MYGSKNINKNGLESDCMQAKKWGLILDLVQEFLFRTLKKKVAVVVVVVVVVILASLVL